MPWSAPKVCSHGGCGALATKGSRCDLHRRQERQELDRHRGTAHQRGYSAAWQKARAGWLRAHPLCVRHQARGELMAADVVDHIKPHGGNKALFWDSANWQSLCKRCHDIKTATEDGRWGRRRADG